MTENRTYTLLGDNLLQGKLVRFAALEDEDIAPLTKWMQSTELMRHLWGGAIYMQPESDVRDFFNGLKQQQAQRNAFLFTIRTLEKDELIGHLFLTRIDATNLDCQYGIAIDNPEFWGGGYGTDATAIILRFAFMELNRHRVSLRVYEYNQRAIRSYEKLGFQHEGRIREGLYRDGQRFDICMMGILRSEWTNTLSD